MLLNKELVNYQNKLYWIYRKVKPDQIKSEYVSDVKQLWYCDIVIRGKYKSEEEYLLFLREISDATIVNS
jgi:hypothetical protein